MKTFKDLQSDVESLIEDAKPVNTTSASGKKLVSAFDVINHANKIAKAEGSYHDARKTKLRVTREHLARARSELLGESELDETVVSIKKDKQGHVTRAKTIPDADEPFNYAEWKASSVKKRAMPGWGKNGGITKMVAASKAIKEDSDTIEEASKQVPNFDTWLIRNRICSEAETYKVIDSSYNDDTNAHNLSDAIARFAKKKDTKGAEKEVARLASFAVTGSGPVAAKAKKAAATFAKEMVAYLFNNWELFESEQLDELSIGTLKTYIDKARDSSAELVKQGVKAKKLETSHAKLNKAVKRLDNAHTADRKVFRKEWNAKVGIKEETEEAIPYKELVKKFQSKQDTEKQDLPHGHTMNPTSDENRHQLIKKVRGE